MNPNAPDWKASWTQAVTDIRGAAPALRDVTVRLHVQLAFDGTRLRFVLSNHFGTEPVLIGQAAVVTEGASTQATFGGRPTVEISPGADLTSDPVELPAIAGRDLFIDLFLPMETSLSTGNIAGSTWSISEVGNHAGRRDLAALPTPSGAGPDGVEYAAPMPLLRSVEVAGADVRAVVACLGDSITAAGWPNRASVLLAAQGVALVNRGIPGNRLHRDGAGWAGAFFGRSGLARFDDDVVGTSGVTHALIALGTNDLGHPGTPAAPSEPVPSASDLIGAFDALVQRCRQARISPVLATITPFLPAAGYDTQRDAIRQEVNEWIRSSARAEIVVDFDRALRSSVDRTALAPEYDSGDHLHPSDAGQDRLAREAASAFS
ncbi:GDSL-type esterase/lipase family protein [Agromyces albus]|uniref:GDSL family lipase n=1 Tax=Agromyces albus TaxID=205332 RepID=A0A4Q2L4D6_9MICO|nr:GDSL-type esterase/lipase family protein [Agromyces albus]RXZ71202.1 GDSL family lipase [Agromyces albus]